MSANGHHPGDPKPIEREDLHLRIVVFGESIVSEIANPRATSSRAICRALLALGHDVTFLEDRKNEALVRQLREYGSAPLRAASEPGTALPYRTYDAPTERERNVWLGREATTADAFIVLDDTPAAIRDAATVLTAPHLIRLCEPAATANEDAIVLRQPESEADAVPFGPVVLPRAESNTGYRLTILSYAPAAVTRAALDQLTGMDVRVVVSGEGEAGDWARLPEERLEPELADSSLVIVIPGTTDPGWSARALLPVAAGARSIVLGGGALAPEFPATRVDLASLAERVNHALGQPVPPVPARFDATPVAAELAARVRSLVDARWGR